MKRNKLTILIALVILAGYFYSCKKTEYIIEEPVVNESDKTPPGTFSVDSVKTEDTRVTVYWTAPTDPDGEKITYEIGLNDSVVAYDLDVHQYTLSNLAPDTDYKVSVFALDPSRNSSRADTLIHTREFLLKSAFQYTLDYTEYDFRKVIRTSDSGFMVLGVGRNTIYSYSNRNFLMKLNADFSVAWQKEFDWETNDFQECMDVLECPDKGFLIVQFGAVIKVSESGQLVWKFTAPESYNYLSLKAAVRDESTGDFFVLGITSQNYLLIRLSANGDVLWHKTGENVLPNSATGIKDLGDKLLIYGVTINNEQFWLLKTDKDGNKLDERTYPNSYSMANVLTGVNVQADGSFVLYGAFGGDLPPYGYYDTRSRITKISTTGEMVWDSYPDMDTPGYFYAVWLCQSIGEGLNLFQASDDKGMSFYVINDAGKLQKKIRIKGYPTGLYMYMNSQGDYVYFTTDGWVISVNPEGYIK